MLAGCDFDENATPDSPNTAADVYPTVDDSFLSAIEWRFIGPYRDVRSSLNERRGDLQEGTAAEADAILHVLREIEGLLMIWMGNAEHPMMWNPPGLTEKLSSLSGAVNSGDTRPTASMYAVFAELTQCFEQQQVRLNQIIDQELAPQQSE